LMRRQLAVDIMLASFAGIVILALLAWAAR
jgi:hypothetical protein